MAGFRLSLEQRFQEGDTLPHSWRQLEEALPDKLEGFAPQNVQGGTFSPGENRFSAISQFFTNEEGEYLFIKISDYAADSSAISFWLNRRETKNKTWPGEAETIVIEDESSDLVRRKSAIRGSRYLISLATNHPDGEKLLDQALANMNWKKLP